MAIGPTSNRKDCRDIELWRQGALSVLFYLLISLSMADEVPSASDEMLFSNVTLQTENDAFAFAAQDRWYTHGFKASWATNYTSAPDWLQYAGDLFPGFEHSGHPTWWGWSLEQRIFTPSDISNPEFPPQDRPYAGWLNYSYSMAALHRTYIERFHLGIGIVGELSLAEGTQKAIHDIGGGDHPVGWGSQLPTEPTLLIAYDRQWRLGRHSYIDGYQGDWAPSAGIALSNAIVQAEAGVFWRMGRNLPDDFGPPRITAIPSGASYFRPTADSGWYLCAGVNGKYVAHNLFLDGTTLRESPSVESKPWVGEAFLGYVHYLRNLRFSYVFVRRSKEFESQSSAQNVGAVTLTWAIPKGFFRQP